MIGRFAIVAARIRQELDDIERVVTRAERGLAAARRSSDADLFIDSVALNLHDFYTGCERVFHRVATEIDGALPSGPDWHRELLPRMSLALEPVRPRVLSPDVERELQDYLGFRHVVRNVYAFVLRPERIEQLVLRLRPLFTQIREQLLGFAAFLDDLARADEQPKGAGQGS